MQETGNVTRLEYDGREIFVVGTAHVSQRSVDEVRRVISEVKPDSVCVELDKTRYDNLVDEERFRKLDIFQVIKEKKVLYFLATLTLTAYQKRLGDKLGVRPGAEMQAAIEKAKEQGSEVVLADRDIQATLKRSWASLSFWNKIELTNALIAGFFTANEINEEQIEQLKDKDTVSEMMREFAQVMPRLQRPLIDERDRYLIAAVREAPGKKVVAVVGAGHVGGMIGYLNEPVDRQALSLIPPPTLLTQSLKWLIPLTVFAAFFWGWHKHQGAGLLEMVYAWVLPTSVLGALGTLLGGGRPLTILATFLASPITTLNPTIGAGMIAAFVEAWIRRPTVADCEQIPEAIASVRGAYKNPFTRVLIVALGATLGAALGAYVGAAWVIKLL
jgi:pheromone shutdown-related protein TraB